MLPNLRKRVEEERKEKPAAANAQCEDQQLIAESANGSV